MVEYGIQVSDSTGQELQVYFCPLSYGDWVKYTTDLGPTTEPAAIRYVFTKYITRVYQLINNGIDTSYQQVPTSSLVDMSQGAVQNVMSAIFKKSVFGEDELFLNVKRDLEVKSRTLMGSYDYFIFIHGGADLYSKALEMDALGRAQIIMMIEKATGINVEQRFRDSVEFQIPLDLISDTGKYENKIKNDARHGRISSHAAKNRQAMPEGTYAEAEGPPVDMQQMMEASRRALEQDLAAGRSQRKQRKTFNWHEDEAAFGMQERRQEKDMLTPTRRDQAEQRRPGPPPPKGR